MMRSFRTVFVLLIAVLVAASAAAQSRGTGRITGKVVDEAGKPIADVDVKAVKVGESQVFNTKTNEKGEWTFAGLAGGSWNIDFSKPGLETVQRAAAIVEGQRLPAVSVSMKPAAATPEDSGAAAAKEMEKAEEHLQAGRFAEARAIYDALTAKFPDVYQLQINMGRTYAAEGNIEKANEHFKTATGQVRAELATDPANQTLQTLLAFLLQSVGENEEAATLLAKMDVAQVKDPILFVNAAIFFINSNKATEAVDVLNRVIAQFTDDASLLYYRARAYLAASKFDEAKADLEKFVAANPTTAPNEVEEAKKLLAQLSKVKK